VGKFDQVVEGVENNPTRVFTRSRSLQS
jgi:hypothetical protein